MLGMADLPERPSTPIGLVIGMWIVGLVVGLILLSWIIGFITTVIKIAVLVAVLGAIAYVVLRFRSR